MNPFEMVIGIILIVTIGNVIKTRLKAKHGIIEDEDGNERLARPADTGEAARLREEVRGLKERVQVLERVITDQRQSNDLSVEIEKLRDR